jgi:hypothetical protein
VPLDYVELGRRLRLPLEEGRKKRRAKKPTARPGDDEDDAKAAR